MNYVAVPAMFCISSQIRVRPEHGSKVTQAVWCKLLVPALLRISAFRLRLGLVSSWPMARSSLTSFRLGSLPTATSYYHWYCERNFKILHSFSSAPPSKPSQSHTLPNPNPSHSHPFPASVRFSALLAHHASKPGNGSWCCLHRWHNEPLGADPSMQLG